MSDLHVCRAMRWTYDELLALPVDVYEVLVEELRREAAAEAEKT